nr:hypothetical protein [Oleisolibacter albus]
MLQQMRTGRSQAHAATVAFEQTDTQFLFQAIEGGAERRLRDPDCAGGPTDIQLLCGSDEQSKLAQLHHRSPTLPVEHRSGSAAC